MLWKILVTLLVLIVIIVIWDLRESWKQRQVYERNDK